MKGFSLYDDDNNDDDGGGGLNYKFISLGKSWECLIRECLVA